MILSYERENFQSDNHSYNDFQHLNFIFSWKIASLFWSLFNDEIDFGIRYMQLHE
jgi:hypothetical protein